MVYLRPIINKLVQEGKLKGDINTETDETILEDLDRQGVVKEKIMTLFSRYYGVDYIDLTKIDIDCELSKRVNLTSLGVGKIIMYSNNEEDKLHHYAVGEIGKSNILNAANGVSSGMGYKADFKFAFPHEIILASNKETSNATATSKKNIKRSGSQTIPNKGDFNPPTWVNNVIQKGISLNASDIHIEPKKEGIYVRYRIDGLLGYRDFYELDVEDSLGAIIRIKILSKLDITEKRKPQDGVINEFEYGDGLYSMRVSTLNTQDGEKVVMRIFSMKNEKMRYEDLGLNVEEINQLKKLTSTSNGLVILAGATGSGKTTTLYTMLENIEREQYNVYTVEDPVERTIEGVNQVQLDVLGGGTYPNTLRALLRQDPDIITVGEIRDDETAEICVRSSLTGHLVLTTLHSNTALESIDRMVNLGIEPYLLSIASSGFISQRLIRKLCPKCKAKATEIPEMEKQWVETTSKNYSYTIKEQPTFYEAVGCPECVNGYSGRTMIIEILEITPELRHHIASGMGTNDLLTKSLVGGFKPLEYKGLDLALNGTTTISEVIRNL